MDKKAQQQPYYKSEVTDVLRRLKTSKKGLNKHTAATLLFHVGPNRLEKVDKEWIGFKFLRQFKDLMILLLLVSAGISRYLGDTRTAAILVVIVLINACIGFFQEHKAERIMESLERLVVARAKVMRAGQLIEIDSLELVPGDIMRIDEGDSVPADGRIIDETELSTNDFALTGESNPSRKFDHAIKTDVELALRHNLVFMGTTVATGNAFVVVTDTGMRTELGRIASLSQDTKSDPSPLQREMSHLARRITQGTLILGGILALIALKADLSMKDSFIFAIGIASAMIPQGLTSEVNVALAQAAVKLARERALVKKLSAVETLGATSIICTDKTGTLTKNEMTVEYIRIGATQYHVTGTGYEPKGTILGINDSHLHEGDLEKIKLFFATGVFASNASVHAPDSEHPNWYTLGDPTEGALITLAHKAGIDPKTLDQRHPELRELPFDSGRKRMSSARRYNNQLCSFVKGAPESVLEVSTHIWDGGRIRKLTKADRHEIDSYTEKLASEAMRNLAYAYKVLPANSTPKKLTMDDTETGLVFLGVASMIDPPREEIPEAIAAASRAHIPISIITGDNALTAKAIALKAGLADKESDLTLISGEELRALTDHEVAGYITKGQVIFSRVAPEDKLRIVELGKHIGEVVAVTGDGINDAPALKRADIGVAMGKTGTDVAKQSSEIVLLDDSFHTLVGAIQQGRVIFQNIKKATISCLTSNTGELFTVLISLVAVTIFHIPLAITAVQILAVDLIAELFPIAALGWDPPESELMEERPRRLRDHILNRGTISDLALSGLFIGLLAFGNYLLFFKRNGVDPMHFDTSSTLYAKATILTYLTIVLCQFANILLRRVSHQPTVFSSYLWSNKRLLVAFGFSLFCVINIVYNPLIQPYFGAGPLSPIDWLSAICAGLIYLLARDMIHGFRRKSVANKK